MHSHLLQDRLILVGVRGNRSYGYAASTATSISVCATGKFIVHRLSVAFKGDFPSQAFILKDRIRGLIADPIIRSITTE